MVSANHASNNWPQDFKISLYSRFQGLQTAEENTTEDTWTAFKEAVAWEDVLGRLQSSRKPWIRDDTWTKVGERMMAITRYEPGKNTTVETDSFRKIQRSGKRRQEAAESRAYINDIADQAKEATRKGLLKTLYATTGQ